jgi:hypothetical protein
MKKIIGISIVVIILGGWIYLDYSWDERLIRRVSTHGWIPAAVNDKYVIHPWNFIKCSVIGIWFVNPSGMFRISDDIVIAEVMHFDRDQCQSNSFELVDCTKKLTAYISSEEAKAIDFTKIKWHSFDHGTPGAQLIEFISSRLSSIPKKEKT